MFTNRVDKGQKRLIARSRSLWWLLLMGVSFMVLSLFVTVCLSPPLFASASAGTPSAQPTVVRRVHAPYGASYSEAAIFWFGRVTPAENYADVRVRYDDTRLVLHVAAIDRRLWYDTSPSVEALTEWDAVTVYLDTQGNTGSAPGASTYRFDAQLASWEARQEYQAVFQGDGSGWTGATLPFATTSGWRGDYPNNDVDDRGWLLHYAIPFASLGMDGPPAENSVWGLAVALHDRDDQENTLIDDQVWPETMEPQQPSTWGQLVFGMPAYAPPPVAAGETTTIRHGLDGAVVVDADVGGSSVCGRLAAPDYFSSWGMLNYAGQGFLNIQNQDDIADWPCFSKYYVTFPLDRVPPNRVIISATLTLYLWGGAGEDLDPGPQPSLIQVLSVDSDWDEATITWNNAPLARENLSATWVQPVESYPGRPGIPYHWDVSLAAAQAYASGIPLRLALYEADGAYHSGKYFDTCDTDEWGAEGRPTLKIKWGAALPNSIYLPQLLCNKE